MNIDFIHNKKWRVFSSVFTTMSFCYRLGLMSHFGALAAASSRYAALCGGGSDPRTLPWYWGRIPSQIPLEKPSPNGTFRITVRRPIKNNQFYPSTVSNNVLHRSGNFFFLINFDFQPINGPTKAKLRTNSCQQKASDFFFLFISP